MTKREIAFGACRLMAVYLFMSNFFVLSHLLAPYATFSSISTRSPSATSFIVNFNGRSLTGLELFLFFLVQLAPVILQLSGATLLWFIARDIAVRLFDNVPEEITTGPTFVDGYSSWDAIWDAILRIPISLWLIFGLRGVAGLWRLAQEKGLTPKHKG